MFRRVLPAAAVLLLVALSSGVAHGASLYPPKNVTATAASYDRINLQWSAANGTAYEVFRSTTSGGPYTRIASTASTEYADTGLKPITRYYYVITSVYAGSSSRYSKQASATTQVKPPMVVRAVADVDRVNLSWDASASATSYSVLRFNNGTWIVLATVTGTTHTDRTVATGTSYVYRIRALNGALSGESHDIWVRAGAPTTTSLRVSPAPSEHGQRVLMTATVVPVTPSGSVYMGDVAFIVDGVVRGHVQVDSRQVAEFTTPLSEGQHVMYAHYEGDDYPSLGGSSSLSISQPVSSGYGQFAIQSGHIYQYGLNSHPTSVAVADVTGDGRGDAMMTTTEGPGTPQEGYRLYVFAQKADGTLGLPRALTTHGMSSGTMAPATGDVDADGDADVALTGSRGIDVFLQSGGRLAAPVLVSTASRPLDMRLADVNGDRRADLVISEQNRLTVRRSIDGRSYAAPVVIDGVNRGGVIAVGDLTGDGRPDVARLSVIGESVVRLYAQTSTGRFVLRSTYQVLPPGWMRSPSSLAVGDLTGDGRRDFAVTIDANDPGSWIMVWPRTNVGTFGKPVIYPVYHNAESLALADMDRDGRLDAASLHGGWQAAGVMLQRPEGRLGRELLFTIPYATAYTARGLALGDVTGDGRADLVIADYNYGLIVLDQR